MIIESIPVRQQQKMQTRRRLIDIAFNEFSRNGVATTRTVDIAHGAGVAHGTVFVHFPTREELIIEVIGEFGIKVAERMHELAKAGKGVRAVLEAHLKGLEEYEDFYAHLISELNELPREAHTALIGIQSAISFHLFEAAHKGMSLGIIKSMPAHFLFNTWVGLLHHYLQNRELFAPNGSVIKNKGPELLDHFMNLIS